MASCVSPLLAFRLEDGSVVFERQDSRRRVLRELVLPCGRCEPCAGNHAAAWGRRCMHEASLHELNCWLTPTYADGHRPSTLDELQRGLDVFLRRMRKAARKRGLPLRYFAVLEHGERTHREHWHICVFGYAPDDLEPVGRSEGGVLYRSPLLDRLWGKGGVRVAELTEESARYTASYTAKSLRGPRARVQLPDGRVFFKHSDGRVYPLPEAFMRCSNRPGIGAEWAERWACDLWSGLIERGGAQRRMPAYYRKLLARRDAARWDERIAESEAANPVDWSELTPERLEVKREVFLARTANVGKRSL